MCGMYKKIFAQETKHNSSISRNTCSGALLLYCCIKWWLIYLNPLELSSCILLYPLVSSCILLNYPLVSSCILLNYPIVSSCIFLNYPLELSSCIISYPLELSSWTILLYPLVSSWTILLKSNHILLKYPLDACISWTYLELIVSFLLDHYIWISSWFKYFFRISWKIIID